MRLNRTAVVLMGAALLAGCGAEEPSEASAETALGEGLQAEAAPGESVVAAVLPAYCSDVTTWSLSWVEYENQVLTLVNQRRAAGATCGGTYRPPAPPLTFNENLRCAARKHSKDMGTKNFFSHTGSNGSTFSQRITSSGYSPWRAVAENISAGHTSPSSVVNAWMASAGHCANIMNPTYKHLGVGYSYHSTSTYKAYWTQDFGAQ